MLLRGEHRETGEMKYQAVKCSKRGNDVYGDRVKKRLGFLKKAEDLVFFKREDFGVKKVVKTRLLWISFTWDSKLCGLEDSWLNGEYFWNLMITNLRNKYGRISVLKFPQASPGKNGKAYGYLHYHAVFLFQDHEFTVFPDVDKGGVLSYRIHRRSKLKNQAKWHSYVDIKAISSMKGIYNYAVKHHENAGFGDSEDAVLNNSLCWLFKKKSYTISGDFRRVYSEFIYSLRNSKVFTLTLDGEMLSIWVWKLVGFRSGEQLGLVGGGPWVLSLSADEVDRLFGGKPRG